MLEVLRAECVEFDVIEYLKNPLSEEELSRIVDLIDGPPESLVRNDNHFKELGLSVNSYKTKSSVVQLLSEHPRLMQRPVVASNAAAVIARPSELAMKIIRMM